MKETEFSKFDATVRKVLSVSHDELVRREKEWKRQRQVAKKNRGTKIKQRKEKS